MGHHESDEAYDAAAGHHEGDHEGGEEKQYAFDFLDFDAETFGGLAAGEQQVEVFGKVEYDHDADEHHRGDHRDVEPRGAGEAAHRPEDDAVHLVLPQDHDERDECGDEEGEAYAGEQQRGGVEAVADGGYAVDEPHGEQGGGEGADADAPHVALKSEEDGEGGAERRARRDAQHVGVGQGVAEHRLVGGAAHRQAGSGQEAEEYAGQTQFEENLRVQQLGGLYLGDAQQRARHDGGDKQQTQQRDGDPEG